MEDKFFPENSKNSLQTLNNLGDPKNYMNINQSVSISLKNLNKKEKEPIYSNNLNNIYCPNKQNNNHLFKKISKMNSLEEQLHLSENTMPGLFISTMLQRNQPVNEKDLYDCVTARLSILRKPDGSKYKLVYILFNSE
jgi:hypothetical protein